MRPADLTPPELADLLHQAFEADLGGLSEPLRPEQRTELADYLGCHPDARDATWEAWQALLEDAGHDPADAEYWLDVEFIEPCPENGPGA
ncbi:hypothetical protein [Deinococcus ficus]|uniref:Uncharacterized protein n=1 Tax=Deinococcus ficus TaxID=317577 RepID=A0A221T3K8_9DEIO|nr:hypothetical protein [Deinococcus ficus]ASN83468.1 hypothetical protein DFI_19925 [Deinococcus ficus]